MMRIMSTVLCLSSVLVLSGCKSDLPVLDDGDSDYVWTDNTQEISTSVVHFFSNGGNGFADKTYLIGQSVGDLKTPTLEGYEFDGWYNDSVMVTPSFKIEKKEYNFYAKWDELEGMEVYLEPYILLNDSNISIKGEGISVSDNTITVSQKGTYNIYGGNENVSIVIDAPDKDVVLVLNNMTLSSIISQSANLLTIRSMVGTINTISDSGNQETDKAVVYSTNDIIFEGAGEIIIRSLTKSGIITDKNLKITGGFINIIALEDGLKAKDYVDISGGQITLNVEGNGILTTNDKDKAQGNISITGGSLNINALNKGITAVNQLIIKKGIININSGDEGIQAINIEITDVTLVINSEAEGIVANLNQDVGTIFISGGSIKINSLKDGINSIILTIMGGNINIHAGVGNPAKGLNSLSKIIINEGIIKINSTDDAIYSAGKITINGARTTIKSLAKGMSSLANITFNNGVLLIDEAIVGIESQGVLSITGGNIKLDNIDIGLNSPSTVKTMTNKIIITGGNIYINALKNGILTDGNAKITGGKALIYGLNEGNINVSGGQVLAMKSKELKTSPQSGQKYLSVDLMASEGSIVCISDSANKPLICFKTSQPIESIIYSSKLLNSGAYTVRYGGSYSGESNINGIYNDGIYSGGQIVIATVE